MRITRRQLRRLINEEIRYIVEMQMSSTNSPLNQPFQPPSETSRPYITGVVKSSDIPQSLEDIHSGMDAEQAAKIFNRKEGISEYDYNTTCEPRAGGSYSCMARKTTLGPESVYSSEEAPPGAESMEESKNK